MDNASDRLKRPRKRYGTDPLDDFTDFNFAQATARVIENIGFTATKPYALEIMSQLMDRYFKDMCKRIAYSKENVGRHEITLDDVISAYKGADVSIEEFEDYLKQVGQIPSIPEMPMIPVEGPNKTDLTLKAPPKKVIPVQEEAVYIVDHEDYLQESSKEFDDLLNEIKSTMLVPEHPLVSIRNYQSKTKTGVRKRSDEKKFFRIRIGDEVIVEKELVPRADEKKFFRIRIGDEVIVEKQLVSRADGNF
ncbi:Transcription initiation factor TFIID subunit 3 [Aphelenchoides bicaudatus]|nr:Transcription initiation factor TFIID subunit 3 [Aphelenchoides bicaudatus]